MMNDLVGPVNKKIVYIATFCVWRSFGSILQSFSLCSFLKDLGYDAKLIDYNFEDVDKLKKSKLTINQIKNSVFCIQEYICKKGTQDFINQNVPKTNHFERYDELVNLVSMDACFIAGSDQIWNPDWCSPFFFLQFAKDSRKVSYAASMGKTDISEDKYDSFSNCVSGFDYISVRENDACDVINQIVGGRAECHVDPTFLHDSMFWMKYEKPYKIRKKYILLYPLYWDKKYNDKLREISEKQDVEIVALSKSFSVYCTKRIVSADLGQFLYLIHHAEAVVTSSFHGLALSLNYHKRVCVVVNPSMPSRFDSLMDIFSINNIKAVNDISFSNIDYERFEVKREQERKRAEEYLKLALGNS